MGLTVFVRVFTPLFFAQAALSVIVTLDGQTGIVVKKVNSGDATAVLACSLSSSGVGGTPSLEWTKASDPSEEGSHIYYQNALVTTNWPTDKFYHQSPFSLGIRDIDSGDNGYYKCRGVLPGDTPSAASATYNLVVLVPPSDEISCGFPSDLAITRGQSAQFQCAEISPQANPPPTFTWYKNGMELPTTSSGNSAYPNSSFSYDTNTGLLKFQTVVSADAGEYSCTVTNEAGSSSCSKAEITTKEVNVGAIVGIVFGVLFAIILIGVLIWWTYRRGYCDGLMGEKDHEDELADDGANDIMLDGAGPLVTKAPSEYSNGTSHKDSLHSSGPYMPEGAVRVMP